MLVFYVDKVLKYNINTTYTYIFNNNVSSYNFFV